MAKGWNERLQWIFTLGNTLKDVMDIAGKVGSSMPEPMKQRMPKLFGLTLDDEQIFNGALALLDMKYQIMITKFLQEKCKDYERNRFINIVAGMEVKAGSPAETETKWDSKTGNKVFEKTKAGSPGVDCRKIFLEKFAERILDPSGYNGDLDRAYEDCVGGRMIIPDPMTQKTLRAFSDSIGTFKKLVLMPFGVDTVEALAKKAGKKISEAAKGLGNSAQTFEDNARARSDASKVRYKAMKARRKK